MSGKRRAAGPSNRRTPTERPGRGPATGSARGPAKDRGKTGRGKHPRLRRVITWLALLGLLGVVVLAGVAVIIYRAVDLPASGNADFKTETSFIYYDDGSTEVGQFATQNRESITYDQMPQTMKDAVIAIENPTFWTDRGIDPKGILRAAFSNARGNDTQGGSTITQQYVKILYLNQERSYTRKAKEAVLALKLQQQQSKQEILTGYLNTIYFGNGAYGVQAAAKAYFDVDASALTLPQSATLAAVLNNPSLFDPYEKDSKKRLRSRYQLVLDKMVEHGDATQAEVDASRKRLPTFPPQVADSTYGGQKGHMLELVKNELREMGYSDTEIEGGGLKVTTTFDKAAMDNAEAAVAEVRPAERGDDELHVAVASVEPGTGALKGFYGGQDYLESQINWASAGGMVGSTFKPFTLATALGAGFSLRDTFEGNSPYEFPDGSTVQNEGSGTGLSYGSSISAVTAMEESVNTAFIDMTASIPDGPTKIVNTAERMGIPPVEADAKYPGIPSTSRDLEADARVSLGRGRVSPINMANAFATIADDGKRSDVHVIEKVVSPDPTRDYDRASEDIEPVRAISSDIAADVSYSLQETVSNGTGANAQAIDRPAAGKTGTATAGENDDQHVSSSWFVGYTPQLSTAVMYVRGDGDDPLDDDWLPSYQGATGYFGSNYPTRTWAAVMEADLEGTDVEEFPPPAYVDGDAPDDGHSPTPVYTPPPAKPKPSSRPTPSIGGKPTKKPTRTPPPVVPTSVYTPPTPVAPTPVVPPPPVTTTPPSPQPTAPVPVITAPPATPQPAARRPVRQ